MNPKIIELIVAQERIGTGTKDDPVRLLDQLFTKQGGTVAFRDPHTGEVFFSLKNTGIHYEQ